MKILVFKFSKNEKESKKKGEGADVDEMINMYVDHGRGAEPSYNLFKQVSSDSEKHLAHSPPRTIESNQNSKVGSI